MEPQEYAVTFEYTLHAREFVEANSQEEALTKARKLGPIDFDEEYATIRIVEVETPEGEIIETDEIISEP
jgi:hypothetical protein